MADREVDDVVGPPLHGGPRRPEAAPGADELLDAWAVLHDATVATATRLAEGLRETGHLTPPAFDVLLRLYREPAQRLPMSRVAAGVGLTAGGFTKLADRMEIEGLITREHRAGDRRVVHAALTPRGRDLTETAVVRHVDELRRHLLRPLGADGLRTLTVLARALRDHHAE